MLTNPPSGNPRSFPGFLLSRRGFVSLISLVSGGEKRNDLPGHGLAGPGGYAGFRRGFWGEREGTPRTKRTNPPRSPRGLPRPGPVRPSPVRPPALVLAGRRPAP